MQKAKKKVAVLGAGSWGTALAVHLTRAGHGVSLWGRDSSVLEQIRKGENKKYLLGVRFAETPNCFSNLAEAVKEADGVVLAVPSASTRELLSEIAAHISKKVVLINAAKGLEQETNLRFSEVAARILPNTKYAVLSGPSFAKEVLERKPTAITIAAKEKEIANEAAKIFHFEYFRVYTSTDLAGIEYGGALKNVLAVAIGIADGMEMGLNTRAALITRGLAELGRFVEKLGGSRSTISGLSGLGDLLLTATGDLSRNRQVGVRLGRGEKLADILESIGQVAEGVKTAEIANALALEHNIDAPIVNETYNVITGKTSPQQSLKNLLERDLKEEHR